MRETISEPIEVVVAFRRDKVEPMTFKWANRYYQIKKINMVHSEGHGRDKVTSFFVSDLANSYHLKFSADSMKWDLEEMMSLQ
jgi:hypothetical protein